MDYTLEQTFEVGQRVELHPGCDLWMRGARYGTVDGTYTSGIDTVIVVVLDHKGLRPVHCRIDRLRHV